MSRVTADDPIPPLCHLVTLSQPSPLEYHVFFEWPVRHTYVTNHLETLPRGKLNSDLHLADDTLKRDECFDVCIEKKQK